MGTALYEPGLGAQLVTDERPLGRDPSKAYIDALRDPAHAHGICEEYRAAATVDREHDGAARVAGNRIQSPLLALWSVGGPLGTWYEHHAGVLRLWQDWAVNVSGRSMDGGHFFPEETPSRTAEALADFFG